MNAPMHNHDPRSEIDDIDLGASIAALLHRRTALASIIVAVAEGVVTLEGEVQTSADRRAAESVVRRFAGVRGIENSLMVQAAASEEAESAAHRRASE
ncbi:MAG TPA: BON domain-containing protein [Candidatus Baltobacteraceae bacterium]|nr:BON domain-containing protein [Candidatus Baltobacteraceae bacterium]